LIRDLLVGQPIANQPYNFLLTFGQWFMEKLFSVSHKHRTPLQPVRQPHRTEHHDNHHIL
jgi:hypothetical protein